MPTGIKLSIQQVIPAPDWFAQFESPDAEIYHENLVCFALMDNGTIHGFVASDEIIEDCQTLDKFRGYFSRQQMKEFLRAANISE